MNARPMLGWLVFVAAIAVRLWALPVFVVAWLVGVITQAAAFGFAVAWEAETFAWARRLREGVCTGVKQRPARRQVPALADDDWSDDYED